MVFRIRYRQEGELVTAFLYVARAPNKTYSLVGRFELTPFEFQNLKHLFDEAEYIAQLEGTEGERMRHLTDHIVSGDQAVQLQIEVTDEPGAGGANHRYLIRGFDDTSNPSNGVVQGDKSLRILFQNGPIQESGVNGITNEALLAIVIDRLRSFQSGPFACQENGRALLCCEEALNWLQQRTVARIRRGVEGTLQP